MARSKQELCPELEAILTIRHLTKERDDANELIAQKAKQLNAMQGQNVELWKEVDLLRKDLATANSRLEVQRVNIEALQLDGIRIIKLADLFYEIDRRAGKEHADDGNDFTVTIDFDMWKQIKDYL